MTRVLKVKGLRKLERKFKRFPNEFREGLEDATRNSILHMHEKMPPYPPPIPGQRYRRTATLGRTLTSFEGSTPDALSRIRSMGTAVVGFIGTKLEYARWVIDEERQAFMHVGRWWTLQGVFEGERQEIVRIYERMVRRIIERKA